MKPLSEITREADAFFQGRSETHAALAAIVERLESSGTPYAILGGLAVNAHGHQRTTHGVDVLLRASDRTSVADIPLAESCVAGSYPGDGKPKPVRFPDPAALEVFEVEGVPMLPLESLIELKLASGISTTHRLRDLDDVMHLIRVNQLDRAYAERLDPYVRAAFLDRWDAAQIDDGF